MARLTATFGTPKDRTPDQMRLMVTEWFKALRPYGAKTVTRAFDAAILNSKWFPALAEIADHCSKDLESWRDAIGIDIHETGQKPFTDKPRPTLTVEECAKRAADCIKWREEFGLNADKDELRIGEDSEIKASQEATVSAELMNSCAVRRAKGLETCEYNCSRRACGLRA